MSKLVTTKEATMSAHTPGPWRQEYEHIYAHKDGNNTHLIAEVFTGDDDARLIAAAPRMLELIKSVWGNKPPTKVEPSVEARAILRDVAGESNG